MRVLYEDNHLLAVEKPAGVPTQGDRSGDPSLLDQGKEYLKHKYEKPGAVFLGLVHRLDRPTGGVVLFARTSKAAGRLSAQFRERKVEKRYLALCLGQPEPPQGELIHHLIRQPDQNRMKVIARPRKGSKTAELSYKTLAHVEDRSLVMVAPVTGRRHQIRVQMSKLGCPLMGDVKYGRGPRPKDGLVRSIGLWAFELTFEHPVKKAPLTLRSLPPLEESSDWAPFAAFLQQGRHLD